MRISLGRDLSAKEASHRGVELGLAGGLLEQVISKGNFPFFKESDSAGSSKRKIAAFITAVDFFAGSKRLGNGPHVRGADIDHQDGAETAGLKLGDHSLILPQVGKVAAKSNGGNGEERSVDEAGGGWDSRSGEMKAVIIGGTEAGENKTPFSEPLAELIGAKKRRKRETLPFDEDRSDLRDIWEPEVAAIAWECGGVWIRVKGTGFEFELSNEKLVEAFKGFQRLCELGGIEGELLDEGCYERATRRTGHSPTIPSGKKGLLDYLLEQRAPAGLVGEA